MKKIFFIMFCLVILSNCGTPERMREFYINNDSDHKLIITGDIVYTINSNEEFDMNKDTDYYGELSNTEIYSKFFTNNYPSDTLVVSLTFDDSITINHISIIFSTDSIVFQPTENNILDANSWCTTLSKNKNNEVIGAKTVYVITDDDYKNVINNQQLYLVEKKKWN